MATTRRYNNNRYAGAEITRESLALAASGPPARPPASLLVKGLKERGHAEFVRRTLDGALYRALVQRDPAGALAYSRRAVDALASARVSVDRRAVSAFVRRLLLCAYDAEPSRAASSLPRQVDELSVGAYLWRTDRDDLACLAAGCVACKGELKREHVNAKKQNHVAHAAKLLARHPGRLFRLGEFVSHLHGATKEKTQCTSTLDADDAIARGLPVDLGLYVKKLQSALLEVRDLVLSRGRRVGRRAWGQDRSLSGRRGNHAV